MGETTKSFRGDSSSLILCATRLPGKYRLSDFSENEEVYDYANIFRSHAVPRSQERMLREAFRPERPD